MGSNYYQHRNKYPDEFLIEVYRRYGTLKAAEQHVDVSSETIRRVLKRHGIKPDGRKNNGKHNNHKNGTPRKITDEQLVECCKTMTRKEIASKFNMHVSRVDARMYKLGIHAVKEALNEKSAEWHWTQGCADMVERCQNGRFDLVEFKRNRIRIRCRECGDVIERSRCVVRRNNVQCAYCNQTREARAALIKMLSSIKKCPVCGSMFIANSSCQKYCSRKCRNKEKSKARGYRSRARKYGVKYEIGITLKKVCERDNGICQICGEPVDWNDHSWNGSFGPDYPTIDHVLALANGGGHTWDNVQLAHAMCNSCKRDLITA